MKINSIFQILFCLAILSNFLTITSSYAQEKVVVVPLVKNIQDEDLISNNVMAGKEINGVIGVLLPRWGCDSNLQFDQQRCESDCDYATVYANNPACDDVCQRVGSLGGLCKATP